MDVQILKAIIQSHEDAKKAYDLENSNRSLDELKFPPMDRSVLTALTKSFSDLISYKVSPEAYQRYSVRIQLIEVLREWIRPHKDLSRSRAFFQSERVLEFAAKIVKIYLRNELLYSDDGNIDVLVNLAKALICLVPKRKTFVVDLEEILERIGKLKQTEASAELFVNATEEKDSLGLSWQTVENLYIVQRIKLVEAPIVENFIENIKRRSNGDFELSERIEKLLEVCVDSPTIFQLTCSVLKEIFVHCEFSGEAINYIELYLKCLDAICRKKEKHLLDLYPLRCQALVMLLRISPEHHTVYSQEHTILSLVKTYHSNPDETMILMTHYPRWLKSLTNNLAKKLYITDN